MLADSEEVLQGKLLVDRGRGWANSISTPTLGVVRPSLKDVMMGTPIVSDTYPVMGKKMCTKFSPNLVTSADPSVVSTACPTLTSPSLGAHVAPSGVNTVS